MKARYLIGTAGLVAVGAGLALFTTHDWITPAKAQSYNIPPGMVCYPGATQSLPMLCAIVDASGNLHVTGTVTSSAGTTSVTQGTTPWVVGQTTASNLNAAVVGTGTAGSPAGNLLTVQGIAGMTAIRMQPTTVSFVSGFTSSAAAASVQAVAGVTGSSVYITSFNCYNSGTTNSTVTLQDGQSGSTLDITVVPANFGGSNVAGGTGFIAKTTANNGVWISASNASTTIGCTIAGIQQP